MFTYCIYKDSNNKMHVKTPLWYRITLSVRYIHRPILRLIFLSTFILLLRGARRSSTAQWHLCCDWGAAPLNPMKRTHWHSQTRAHGTVVATRRRNWLNWLCGERAGRQSVASLPPLPHNKQLAANPHPTPLLLSCCLLHRSSPLTHKTCCLENN